SGLSPNVTYYFEVGGLNWNGSGNNIVLGSTSTLAATPSLSPPNFNMAGTSSVALEWGANGNSASTLYVLNLSTAPDFSGTLSSSATLGVSAALAGLNPNTTYYGEVQAINNNGIAGAFLNLGSTMTLAAEPQAVSPAFSPVYVASLTLSFNNGSPPNPTGTIYDVQISTDPGFSIWTDSFTANLNASYSGLFVNTTYYAQVAAENGIGEPTAYQALGSTSTLAVLPATVGTTYSNIAATGFTLSWSSGTASTGYNPDNTTYEAQASPDPTFATGVIDILVSATSANFSGLVSGTLYYTQVQALNQGGLPTGYVSYGSLTTLNSSAPSFLNGTFLVSNAAGTFQSPTLYTDTTTPTLQVQAQSNFTPGLSVTDTASQLALWHLDEDIGTTSQDSSTHGQSLTLTQTGGASLPSWVPGELGSGLQFGGTSNTVYSYAVSPDLSLTGWRANAAQNQWSISLWFNTTLAKGYLCQVANSNARSAGTYDAELSWYKSTGKLAFEVATSGGTRRYIQASSAYTDGNWHFATAVLNASGMQLYVDG
ncbi:MAG: LamG-like jellyroll fold domain-containing protein, partial [bacterium]